MVQTILGWLMLAIAVILAFVDIPFAMLAAPILGLVGGLMNPLKMGELLTMCWRLLYQRSQII